MSDSTNAQPDPSGISGGPNPTRSLPVTGGPDLLDRLRAALLAAGLGPTHLEAAPSDDPEGRTLAAGLVLLYPYDPHGRPGHEEPHLVLTQRTTAMRRHSGQISLPGG